MKVDTQVEGKLPTDYLSLILLIMLNAGRDERTSIKVTVYLPFSFGEKISTKQDIASTEISYQFLAPKVSVLRRNKATNSSTSTDPFSAATKTLVLGNLFKLVRSCKICHHIRPGSLPLGIMKRIRRLSYFLHLYPQAANFPCECDVKSKKLE